jgi:endogenous inhibitor of DNA gyrase (YacG/DUF329 family)
MVDLGKWMKEEYSIPASDHELEDEADGGAEGPSKTNEDMRH